MSSYMEEARELDKVIFSGKTKYMSDVAEAIEKWLDD